MITMRSEFKLAHWNGRRERKEERKVQSSERYFRFKPRFAERDKKFFEARLERDRDAPP